MTRRGTVLSEEQGQVLVRLTDDGCEGCTTPCGACSRKGKPQTLRVENVLGAQTGDVVELELSSSAVVVFSLLVFFLPLVFGLALCLILMQVCAPPPAALLSACGALLLLLVTGVFLRRSRARTAPVLTRILLRAEAEKT